MSERIQRIIASQAVSSKADFRGRMPVVGDNRALFDSTPTPMPTPPIGGRDGHGLPDPPDTGHINPTPEPTGATPTPIEILIIQEGWD